MFSLSLLKPTQLYLKIILISYACLTSYSRIYLGVHYPTDILAGAACGVGLGFLFTNFTKVLLEKWSIKNKS
jgi:undecaprenyl-diphosphatase